VPLVSSSAKQVWTVAVLPSHDVGAIDETSVILEGIIVAVAVGATSRQLKVHPTFAATLQFTKV
jgi:hypothetical protein